MSSYRAPLDDIRFGLFDVLQAETLFASLGQVDATRELVDAVLVEAARFSETVLAPLNAVGDQAGCRFDPGTGDVTTPPGFRSAFRQFVDGGWTGLTASTGFGGQGLPHALAVPLNEMVNAANLAWANFPLLSHSAIDALTLHGEDWQREAFLRPLVEGRWTGTMCLTEPHCGTDLGLLRTRAEPRDDGSFAIAGTKIFITAGEHDLSDNIVHLVLARLPDAPAGPKGISLFVAPKYKVARDGSMGDRNALRCGSIEHKMGIRGSATCVMHFDGAEGYLVGRPHQGLHAMFTMMNAARLGVGLQGLGLAERAYQNALRHARERLQSRAPSGALFPDKPADPIVAQPDVRRMLLTIRSLVEGSRLLALHAGTLIDIARHAEDPAERTRASVLGSFLTPIAKACQTEWGVECTYHALQCFGGHGYIVEHGMEQLARDARITTLYEGTTGIQALDLVGRKTAASGGAGLALFLGEIEAFCGAHADDATVAEFIPPLRRLATEWAQLTHALLARAASDPDELGAASYDYLFYSGYVVLAFWWARSVHAVAASGRGARFEASKRETARFYFARVLPRTATHAACMGSGAGSLMTLPADDFDA